MKFQKHYQYVTKYEEVSNNQHGPRYRVVGSERLSATKYSANVNDAEGLKNLAALSDSLDTPLRYDYSANPQEVFIELVSLEQLKKITGKTGQFCT